jgi:putative PIN family toxin of toxin-antitoxin system
MIRIVLDTNILMSGIFWSGPPSQLLRAWYEKKLRIVISPEILNEYMRVGDVLSKKYPAINIIPIIDLITIDSELHSAADLNQPVSRDPDDDKFIALCIAANCKIIVSGDKDLLEISGYRGIEVLKPAEFVRNFLR